MKTKILLLSVISLIILFRTYGFNNDQEEKYYHVYKIGKLENKIDRIRSIGNDSLLILSKQKGSISFFHPSIGDYSVLGNITQPIDFDFCNNTLYLLHETPSKLMKYYLSIEDYNDKRLKVDSSLSLDYTFNYPSSIVVDRTNKYIIVADTGSLNSVNLEEKLYSLKFINYRPGDIVFDDNTREVYSTEGTTNSLLRIKSNGNLEQFIANYDYENKIAIDSKGNLLLLDRLNGAIAKLEKGVGLYLIVRNIEKPTCVTVNRNDDKVFYYTDINNVIYRVEEMLFKNYSKKEIGVINNKTKIVQMDSTVLFVDGTQTRQFTFGKGLVAKKVDKKIINEQLEKNVKKINNNENIKLESNGNLWMITNGDSILISKGMFGYKKVLYSDDFYKYILFYDGVLISIDNSGNKTFISKDVSSDSEILLASRKSVLLRNGNKLIRLDNKDEKPE